MTGDEGLGLDELLRAAEDAGPGESVDVVARNLEKRFSAAEVSFLSSTCSGGKPSGCPGPVPPRRPAGPRSGSH